MRFSPKWSIDKERRDFRAPPFQSSIEDELIKDMEISL